MTVVCASTILKNLFDHYAGMLCNGELSTFTDKVFVLFTAVLLTCGFVKGVVGDNNLH